MFLKRRVKVEFDSVEERTHSIHHGYHYSDRHYVVKLRIYNRGLFRLNGEITSMFGKRWTASERRSQGCVISSQWLDEVAIDLPGRLSSLQNIFRNSAKFETLEPDFFIYEIRTLDPTRLFTLYIYRSFRFFNSFIDVPKYYRRFRLTPTTRMLEQERKLAESKIETDLENIDGIKFTQVPDEIMAMLMSDPLYTLEEIRENFENSFDK